MIIFDSFQESFIPLLTYTICIHFSFILNANKRSHYNIVPNILFLNNIFRRSFHVSTHKTIVFFPPPPPSSSCYLWWDWELNLGLYSCKAGSLPLGPHFSLCLLLFNGSTCHDMYHTVQKHNHLLPNTLNAFYITTNTDILTASNFSSLFLQ
jgi:hypothetical protein